MNTLCYLKDCGLTMLANMMGMGGRAAPLGRRVAAFIAEGKGRENKQLLVS